MRAVLLQRDIVWCDPAANRAAIAAVLPQENDAAPAGAAPSGSALSGIQSHEGRFGRCPKADLYVLPEMFSTGFVTSPEGVAEESPCASLDFMKTQAKRLDAAIAGSLAIHEDGRYYNRLYFVKPSGEVEHYDKRHLFGGESRCYTPGAQRRIVEWRGVRFLLTVCYDLRFPVWLRNAPDASAALKAEYDAIICVASWPERRRKAWNLLLRARAVENQCYVLGVNRMGVDPSNRYNGGSVCVDPWGEVTVRCDDFRRGWAECELDIDVLRRARESFTVLEDADRFSVSR